MESQFDFPVTRWKRLMESFARNAVGEISYRRKHNVPLRQLDCSDNIPDYGDFSNLAYYLTLNWNKNRSFISYLFRVARLPFNCLEPSTYRELAKLSKNCE